MEYVKDFVVEDTKFEGRENSGTALKLVETIAQIISSTFVSNRGTARSYTICRLDICHIREFKSLGGAIVITSSTVDIRQSIFKDNEADVGGAIFAKRHSIMNISNNVFVDNRATAGGVLFSHESIVTIEASKFHCNSATKWGGALYSDGSTITTKANEFHNCSAGEGGVLSSY